MAAPDAIIVGGGHNGLVAAAYLAKAGAKVTVLERRPLVGGAAVTEELHPGFRFSRAAYAAGLLRPGIVHDLDLKRYGYEAFVKEPGSAYVFAHHMLGVIDGRRNVWGFVKGGMGAISQALAAAARDLGVEVRVDTDVERIVIEDGRAVGVRLHGGKEMRAKAILSNADPKRTFLGLVGQDRLEPEFAHAIERFRTDGSATKINVALSELPDFLALPGKAVGPQHRCTIDVASMLDHLERAFDDAKYGDMSREPFLEMYLQSAVDPGMAPPGKHTMTLFTQYTPYHLRNGTWEGRREEWWGRVLDALDAYCPNVRDAVLWKEVLTPPELERVFGLTGGNIFHGEITPDQMFGFRPAKGWAGYRTPIAGLYLCGSGAHPAGGVLGAPGRNAALVALEDLHRRNTFKRTGA